MKVVIFAHTPPPHHGQSYMVQQLLDGFGGDFRKKRRAKTDREKKFGIDCYHINVRLSRNLQDIGELRLTKIFLLLGHCVAAIWCRFRYGAKIFYYIPAPGKGSALFRDWLVMFFCRPFFPKVIFQWQAAGLAKWLETQAPASFRSLTYKFMKQADLSVVLSESNRGDAEKLLPKKIVLVPNAIPDPCPDFEQSLLPRRTARAATRKKLLRGETLAAVDFENTDGDPHCFRILYLAHCTREKGLFDTLDGVALANQQLTSVGSPIRIQLSVAGAFLSPHEQADYEQRIARPDLRRNGDPASKSCVAYQGFVSGAEKDRVFAESDCFCFPTYYYAESFGVVLVEAMAFGLSIVASRWRSIPEVMPKNYPGLVEPRNHRQIADALLRMMAMDFDIGLRKHFLENFTIERHLENLSAFIHSIE